jgi:hypothetical protein
VAATNLHLQHTVLPAAAGCSATLLYAAGSTMQHVQSNRAFLLLLLLEAAVLCRKTSGRSNS